MYVFISLGKITRGRIAESYGKCMFKFFMKLPSKVAILFDTLSASIIVPVAPNPPQHFILSIFLNLAILKTVFKERNSEAK